MAGATATVQVPVRAVTATKAMTPADADPTTNCRTETPAPACRSQS